MAEARLDAKVRTTIERRLWSAQTNRPLSLSWGRRLTGRNGVESGLAALDERLQSADIP